MKQFYHDKKILITGGCGFIGSHIAEKLVHLGAEVSIIDDLSTGFLDNIQPISNSITLTVGSITDQALCNQVTQDKDIIFHLAAFISVPQSVENPIRCHEININGTLTLLEAARKNKVKKFVFSSSSAVYGNTQGTACETDLCDPTSPYGMSKLVGELYCRQYAIHYNLATVCLRYFNVYGPRQSRDGLYAAAVSTFNHRLEKNLPITIFGDGTQTRDFIPVHEVVNANLRCGMLATPLMNGQSFNIATGTSMSINELLCKLRKNFPLYTAAISFSNARPGDAKNSGANCTKYQTLVCSIQKSPADNTQST
jgi:UDP-glucose 4-epimerase